jgi:hypothetical protein
MWSTFKHLSETEAREALRIAEGPVRQIGERRGIIWAEEIMAAIQESDVLGPVIELPQIPEHSELKRWNMQSTMDLSHDEVQRLHDARIAAAAAAQRVQAAADADEMESKRRLTLRFTECEQSRDIEAVTGKVTHKCKCGGKWSNGILGFTSHEDGKKHKQQFPLASWEALYSANRSEQPEAVLAAVGEVDNASASVAGAPGSGGEVNNAGASAENVHEDHNYVNLRGYAGHMSYDERAELGEFLEDVQVQDQVRDTERAAAPRTCTSLPPLPPRPMGLGLNIPKDWLSADQLASFPGANFCEKS